MFDLIVHPILMSRTIYLAEVNHWQAALAVTIDCQHLYGSLNAIPILISLSNFRLVFCTLIVVVVKYS